MAKVRLASWFRLSAVLLPMAFFAACEDGPDTRDEKESNTLLEVYRAEVQPTDPGIGTNIEIRARGGLRIAISTHPGTHFVAGGAAAGQADSCVGVPVQSSPLAVIVKSDATETLLYVALYPGEACVGSPLRTIATSVTTTRPGEAADSGPEATADAETGVDATPMGSDSAADAEEGGQ